MVANERFDAMTAVITGGASGIGLAVAPSHRACNYDHVSGGVLSATQNDTGLVVPGERGKRTVVQSLTMAVLSLSKPLSLNRLSRLEERFSSILPSPGLSQNT